MLSRRVIQVSGLLGAAPNLWRHWVTVVLPSVVELHRPGRWENLDLAIRRLRPRRGVRKDRCRLLHFGVAISYNSSLF